MFHLLVLLHLLHLAAAAKILEMADERPDGSRARWVGSLYIPHSTALLMTTTKNRCYRIQGGGGGAQTSSFTLCVDFDIRRVKNAAVLATVGSQDFSLQYTDRLDRFYVMVVLCFKLSV